MPDSLVCLAEGVDFEEGGVSWGTIAFLHEAANHSS